VALYGVDEKSFGERADSGYFNGDQQKVGGLGKRLQHVFEYLAYRGLEKLVFLLPWTLLEKVAFGLAFIAYRLVKIRRQVTLDNLRQAFPEKSFRELDALAYASYRHFCWVALEFLKLGRLGFDQLETMVQLETPGWLEEYLPQNRGLIMVSGHFGNWEIAGAYFASCWPHQATVIQKRQKNRRVDRHMADLRRRWNMEVVYVRNAVSNCLRALAKQKLVGLLADQDIGRRGVFVPFFGRRASTPPGAALLHLKSGAPLVFAYAYRRERHSFRLGLVDLSLPENERTGNMNEDIKTVLARYNRVLERFVREHPEQYFWMHKRWKTAPPSENVSLKTAVIRS